MSDDVTERAAALVRQWFEVATRSLAEGQAMRPITADALMGLARDAHDRVTAQGDAVTRGRLALAARAERIRIAAMLRDRATTEDVRAGFTEAVDGDPVGAAREAGAAAALLSAATDLEAETRAEDERAGEGDDR